MLLHWIVSRLTLNYPKSMFDQIMNADKLVKVGFIVTLVSNNLFPSISKKLPLLSNATRMLNSLSTLHEHEINYKQTLNPNDIECCFPKIELETFNEIVIGSGPGGSISAYLSCKKNQRTLLIEEGSLKSGSQYHSLLQLSRDFRNSGQELILGNPPIPYAQGRVLGGSSEINSGLYHRLPIHKKQEWLNSLQISEEVWREAEIATEAFVKISKQGDDALGIYSNSPIKSAAEAMDWNYQQIPRWRSYSGSSFAHHGMESTFLKNSDKNLVIMTNHKVIKILPGKTEQRVILNGASCNHEIKTRKVTVACGTIETPRLLSRSGILNTKNFNFGFHSMSRVLAIFDRHVNDLVDIDPHQAWTKDYESKFGVSVSTKGFLEATKVSLGISQAIEHEKSLVFYASNPMDQNGRFIRIGKQIFPNYRLSSSEKLQIKKSTNELIRGLQYAGAVKVLANIDKPSISTVHIFGSLPIGKSLLDSKGTLRNIGLPNIRVCDASIFPSAPLVNPQGALMHLAFTLTNEWLENA